MTKLGSSTSMPMVSDYSRMLLVNDGEPDPEQVGAGSKVLRAPTKACDRARCPCRWMPGGRPPRANEVRRRHVASRGCSVHPAWTDRTPPTTGETPHGLIELHLQGRPRRQQMCVSITRGTFNGKNCKIVGQQCGML